MTAKPEPKLQAVVAERPNDTDKRNAEDLLDRFGIFHRWGSGPAIGQPTFDLPAGVLEVSEALQTYRVEIEAQAKREAADKVQGFWCSRHSGTSCPCCIEAAEEMRFLIASPPIKTHTDSPPTCGLCGKPMPPGEEMFKFHGYSGQCPAPEPEATYVTWDKNGNRLVKPLQPFTVAEPCRICGSPEHTTEYPGVHEPTPAPSKAEELPLGHEFVAFDRDQGPCELCHFQLSNKRSCHEPEAAHRRK